MEQLLAQRALARAAAELPPEDYSDFDIPFQLPPDDDSDYDMTPLDIVSNENENGEPEDQVKYSQARIRGRNSMCVIKEAIHRFRGSEKYKT